MAIFKGRTRVRYGYSRWGYTRNNGKGWHLSLIHISDRFHPLVPVGTAQGPHGHGRIVWKPERKQADAAVLRESNDPGTFLHP